MKCPICDAPSAVLETRQGIYRRRQCFNGHRFTTIEQTITSDAMVYPQKFRKPHLKPPNGKSICPA